MVHLGNHFSHAGDTDGATPGYADASSPLESTHLFDAQAWKEPPLCLWAGYLSLTLCDLCLPSFYIQIYHFSIMDDDDLGFYLLPF